MLQKMGTQSIFAVIPYSFFCDCCIDLLIDHHASGQGL